MAARCVISVVSLPSQRILQPARVCAGSTTGKRRRDVRLTRNGKVVIPFYRITIRRYLPEVTGYDQVVRDEAPEYTEQITARELGERIGEALS